MMYLCSGLHARATFTDFVGEINWHERVVVVVLVWETHTCGYLQVAHEEEHFVAFDNQRLLGLLCCLCFDYCLLMRYCYDDDYCSRYCCYCCWNN
jgi:hypothetical protein